MNGEYLSKNMISALSALDGVITISSVVKSAFSAQIDSMRPANKDVFENSILKQIALYRLMKKAEAIK